MVYTVLLSQLQFLEMHSGISIGICMMVYGYLAIVYVNGLGLYSTNIILHNSSQLKINQQTIRINIILYFI